MFYGVENTRKLMSLCLSFSWICSCWGKLASSLLELRKWAVDKTFQPFVSTSATSSGLSLDLSFP